MEKWLYLWISFFFSPVFIGSVPVDNGVEGDPEITCGDSFIGVKWQTRNPFDGHAFVKGRFGEPACRTTELDSRKNTVEIKLPFSSCGLRRMRSANPKGIFVTVTMVIAFHPTFITKVDRAYYVQCFYMEAEKLVTTELEVSMLTTSLQTQTAPMPICRYEVLEGGPSGTPVKFARIGDQVYHKWNCDTETVDIFCMVVHTCTVDDGSGNQITLLDPNGCAQDKYLLGNLEYITDLMAGKESHVFKYADRPSLYFNCQISIAIREPGLPCARPQCPEPSRGKRNSNKAKPRMSPMDQENTTIGSDVIDVDSDPITVLDVDPIVNDKSNGIPSGKSQQNDVCMSTLGLSGYAAINAILTISSISLFVAAYRRSQKI